MSHSQLITENTYRPEYNAETKQYEDHNPSPRYKTGYRYRCLCNHALCVKSSEFTQHFKTKIHRDFVSNYERNTKDLNDATERIKHLQIKVELQHQTIRRLEQELYLKNRVAKSVLLELD
jgi:hypothetical protein